MDISIIGYAYDHVKTFYNLYAVHNNRSVEIAVDREELNSILRMDVNDTITKFKTVEEANLAIMKVLNIGEAEIKEMKNLKVIKVDSEGITFSNGIVLTSDHTQDCCEDHYLCFNHLKLEDFEGFTFNLDKTSEDWFTRVEDYGIRLVATNGWGIPIPGYGSNTGYYSDNLSLVLNDSSGRILSTFSIDECQSIDG